MALILAVTGAALAGFLGVSAAGLGTFLYAKAVKAKREKEARRERDTELKKREIAEKERAAREKEIKLEKERAAEEEKEKPRRRTPVQLYVYDITKGSSGSFSVAGKKRAIMEFGGKLFTDIEAIWHTSVVVYGKEYTFNMSGVQCLDPPGDPKEIWDYGTTDKTEKELREYMDSLRFFNSTNYNLFSRNCVCYSSELMSFLTGIELPDFIRKQAKELRDKFIGLAGEVFVNRSSVPSNNRSGVRRGLGSLSSVSRTQRVEQITN